MDALIATSRAVNQNITFKRQETKKLQFHTQKIHNITSLRFGVNQNGINTDFTVNLRKAKSAAKLFKIGQEKQMLKKTNHLLLEKLINVQPTYNLNPKQSIKIERKRSLSSSNWAFKINQQNEKMQRQTHKKVQLINQINVKDIKKKIQSEIKEYLDLKNQIRKIKNKKILNHEGYRSQKCKSERRIKPLLQLAKQNQPAGQKDFKIIVQNQEQNQKIK